ncbi:DUF6415 family natural product biosynthesis protein [Streptomyces sp. NPDC053086]|uniref:DUF6415 family natural product biosynthesis protein n=1 Tax=unclassified Streptomyces TaxID=2593676 RepID=UPI0037CD1340
MTHRTAPAAPVADLDRLPPDITTMRATARRLLADDARPVKPEELETLRLALVGHAQHLTDVVELMTGEHQPDDAPAACALACVREARARLRLGAGDNPNVRMSVAMRLARSVRALCDHYENLSNS